RQPKEERHHVPPIRWNQICSGNQMPSRRLFLCTWAPPRCHRTLFTKFYTPTRIHKILCSREHCDERRPDGNLVAAWPNSPNWAFERVVDCSFWWCAPPKAGGRRRAACSATPRVMSLQG